jgi:hypothetical protein
MREKASSSAARVARGRPAPSFTDPESPGGTSISNLMTLPQGGGPVAHANTGPPAGERPSDRETYSLENKPAGPRAIGRAHATRGWSKRSFTAGRMRGARIAGLAMAAGLLAAGCNAPTRRPDAQQAEVYPVAVWYCVRGYVPEAEDGARTAMIADFAHIRSLGFNTVVAEDVDDRQSELLLDAAQNQSLHVVLSDSQTTAYIRGGRSDSGVTSRAESLVRDHVRRVGRHPALLMHCLYDAPPPEVIDRLAEVVQLYRSLDPDHAVLTVVTDDAAAMVKGADLPIVLWDNFPLPEGGKPGELLNRRYEGPTTHADALAQIYAKTQGRQHWTMIQALAMPGLVRFPTPAEWDVIYLSSIAAGFVDGVVVYRYQSDEGVNSGLCEPNRNMPPERTAAIMRLTGRALRWGPLLRSAVPVIGPVPMESNQLRAVLLKGPKRRFLLVYNPDVQVFSYDTVHLPTTAQGWRIARALDMDEPQRYLPSASGTEIPIELRLRPGEGRLLELFGP